MNIGKYAGKKKKKPSKTGLFLRINAILKT